ncbi:hypothetical protein QYE76_032225 [Lolium multiflorum]|uniref:Uncharacterized protein n=1 Tax=Lolium multiflorum TaxID=4521 RepID=A0AAD8VI56_LOLMU|nr:hypothetical protein QYE76_032225 [Lolium multiflorum]
MPGSYLTRYRFNLSGSLFEDADILAILSFSFALDPSGIFDIKLLLGEVEDFSGTVPRTSSSSPLAFSPPPVAARALLPTNLRRCFRRAEGFHRTEFLGRSSAVAASSFLRRPSPLSVAGLCRQPRARRTFSEPFLRVSRSLRSSHKGRSWESGFWVESGVSLIRMSSELYLSESSSNNHQSKASDGLSAELLRMETNTGKDQEASSSGQASGVDLSGVTRGAWKGSDVTQHEIDWLYRSRRIPAGVSCRLPGGEIEPVLEAGEVVVFLAHFECGFGLPASDFFLRVLHHRLPPGEPLFKFAGLESCRAWQETFFYVKNTGAEDLINLPAFNPAVPTKANWGYSPGNGHIETNRIVCFMQQMMRDSDICSDDIIRTFISRRVLPLQRRAHKISKMYGPRDPTRITGLPLSKKDVVLKARHICQTSMPLDWEWGKIPLSTTNPPTDEAKERFPRILTEKGGPRCRRALDAEDPDPYVHWTDLKMGRTHTPRPGNFSSKDSASTNPQVLERVDPLQAKVGDEFIDKLTGRSQKHKAPEPEAGSSHAPPAKRPKKPSKRQYKKREMPVAEGPALKISKSASGIPPESSEETARPSPPPQQSPVPSGAGNSSASPMGGTTSVGCAAPELPDHRAEEDIVSPPENLDTGASNIGADTEAAGRVEPLVPTVPKKKKKKGSASSHSKTTPETSALPKTTSMPPPASSAGGPAAAKPPSQEPVAAKTKPAPAPVSTGSFASGAQPIVLHAGHAAIVAGETAPAPLGRITELSRGGASLGHLLYYAEKWNRADLSAATLGLGKDKMPAVDPTGPRNTTQHFSRLRRAVKEFDTAWHDATNNVVSTADARKRLFEELLWEHRDLAEAHSHCQAVPEASIEALKTQLSNLQAEKDQLIRDHRKALDAQEIVSKELKDQAFQAGLQHDQELKDAKAAAEAKLAEVLEDSTNSSAVLRAELEEAIKARKAAKDQVARLTTKQKEYDQLVMQTDALALRLFPDSQVHAQKKVTDRRVAQKFKNLAAPWDPYDHLVALSARVQHMRAVDRHLVDLPDLALQLFKVLWPEETVPDNLTLISERLKGAGWRIREWQCSAARAGADHALRIAGSWYEDLDLDSFHSLRRDAPTDKDPVLTAKRKDHAYQIPEHAPIRTFIPAPPNVHDFLSDEEEEEEAEDEDAGDAPPEAGDAPPEAPEAGDAPPEAPVA